MPHSVEMPAPVNGTITRAPSTSSCSRSMAVSRSGAIMYCSSPDAFSLSNDAKRSHPMRYLHTMLRVRNLDQAARLLLQQARPQGGPPPGRRQEPLHPGVPGRPRGRGPRRGEQAQRPRRPAGRAHLQLGREDYGEARYFGHLAYEVDDIYALCERLMKAGVTINRPPRDGVMAFVRSPDKHSIELLQKGAPLPPQGAVGLDAQHREVVTAAGGGGCASAMHAATVRASCRFRRRRACGLPCRTAQTPLYVAGALARPSSSGLGHRPFTAVTRVRFP